MKQKIPKLQRKSRGIRDLKICKRDLKAFGCTARIPLVNKLNQTN